ncbi:hypothetical protein Tco_1580527, partial [Tanacetum coccineum]
VVASDLVEMVAAGVGWWRDGDDDDGGWRWVGMTMVFVAEAVGDDVGGSVVWQRLWWVAGDWPEAATGGRKKREENGG